ncbi:hypothetical protein [uncultured Hymenobacter sp.]|uniref:hypothetical protein n=1 Tax=uncultured Hymenobacter sp. TaxID=170016 RepID=UPI0035C9FEEA
MTTAPCEILREMNHAPGSPLAENHMNSGHELAKASEVVPAQLTGFEDEHRAEREHGERDDFRNEFGRKQAERAAILCKFSSNPMRLTGT